MIHRCIDPVARELTSEGQRFEIIPGPRGERFRNIPHTLTGIYRQGRAHGSRRLLQTEGGSWTYDEVFACADRVAGALIRDFGVRPGDYVALALLAGLEWMASFIAVHAVGAAAVMVNTRCAPDEMKFAIAQTGASIIIADAERTAALQTLPEAEHWRMIVSGDRALVRGPGDADLADLLAASQAPPLQPVERGEDDAAIVMFTSGTTGRPKAVRLNDAAMAHAVGMAGLAGAIQDRHYAAESGREIPPERTSASAPTIIAGPVFHVSGITPFLRGMFFGATLFVFSRWNADVALDLMEREPVTRFGFVPTMLADMLNSPRAGQQNLGSLMVLSNGSATFDISLVERIRKLAPDVIIANTFGQTESTGWISTICGADYFAHPESVGYVMPTVEVRIVTDDGREAAVGEHGEILMRGVGMMHSYLGDPDATAETMGDGWLRTGDNGWIDGDGRLYLADRRKNMIITGGENVYCAEVERVLGEHPAVAEVLAYGLPDERFGERVAATVVLRSGVTADAEMLREYARSKLAGYKVPREISFRSTPMPRTPTMKVDRGTFMRELKGV